MSQTKPYRVSHLDALEAESIFVMREVMAEFERPVLLFSGGKDSIVMLRLAEKAFRPDRFPFPLLHIDTEHNFPEVVAFRDARAAELGERLVVRSVGESIRRDAHKPMPVAGDAPERHDERRTEALDAAIAALLTEIEREPVPDRLLELAVALQAALQRRRAGVRPAARPVPSAPG